MSEQGFNSQHTIEVGGPGGIRIGTPVRVLDVAPPAFEEAGRTLSLAARYPRAIAIALGLMGVGLLVGPSILILALELPTWMLVGPVLLSIVVFVAAGAVSRGVLLELERARRRPEFERRLLELATRTRGRLTVPLAAHHLSVSLPEAESLLTSLARAGYVDIDVDAQTGVVLYQFPSLDAEHP